MFFTFELPRGLIHALQQVGLIPESLEGTIRALGETQATPATSATLVTPATPATPATVTIGIPSIPIVPVTAPTLTVTPIIAPTVSIATPVTTPSSVLQTWTKITPSVVIPQPDLSLRFDPISVKNTIVPEIYITPTNITLVEETWNDGIADIKIYKLLGVQTTISPPTQTINVVPATAGTITVLTVGIDIKYIGPFPSEGDFIGLLNSAIRNPLSLNDDQLKILQQICVSYNYAMLKLVNSIVSKDHNYLIFFQENIDISAVQCYFYYLVDTVDTVDGPKTHATPDLTALQMSYIMYNSNKAVDTKPRTRGVGPLIRRLSATGTATVPACQGMSPGIVDTVPKTNQVTTSKSVKYYLALTCTTKKMCQLYFDIIKEFFYLIDKIAGGKHLYEFRTGSPLTQWYTGCNLGAQLGIGLGDLFDMLDIAKGNTSIYTSQTGTYAEMMRNRIVLAIVLTLYSNINDPSIATINPLVKLFTFKIYGNTDAKRRASITNFLNIVRTLFQKSIDKINDSITTTRVACGDNILLRTMFRFQPYTGWAHSLVIVCEATFTPPGGVFINGGYVINNIYFLETYFCSTSTTIPSYNSDGPADDNPKNYPMTTFNYWLFNSKSDKPPYDTMQPVSATLGAPGVYYKCDDIFTPFIEFSVKGFIEILRLQGKNIDDFINAANSLTAQLVLIDENLLDRLLANNCCGSIYPSEVIQTLHSGRPSLHRMATVKTEDDGNTITGYTITTPAPLTISCPAPPAPGGGGNDEKNDEKKKLSARKLKQYGDINARKELAKYHGNITNTNRKNQRRELFDKTREDNSNFEESMQIQCIVNSIPKNESVFIVDIPEETVITDPGIGDEPQNEVIMEPYIDPDNQGKAEPNTSPNDDDDDDFFDLGGGKRRKRSHKRRKSTRRRKSSHKRKSVKKRHSHKKRKHNKRRTRR